MALRRPVLTVLGVAAALVALVLIGAWIAIATVDVNTLVAPVRDKVKEATGRDLRIDGGLSLKLSLEPRLEMRGVTLGNASWASTPTLISAKRLDAQIALLPLLHRQFDIRHIALVEPVIALETDKSGRGNWEFAAAREAAPSSPPAATPPQAVAVAIANLMIDQGVLTYRNGATGTVTRVTIDHLALHASDPQSPVNATFRGAIDGVQVALTGNAGPLAALLARTAPYPVKVEGEIAGRKASLDAKLALRDKALAAEPMDLAFGESRVSGALSIATAGERREVTFRLAAPRLRMADFAVPGLTTSPPTAAPAVPAVPAAPAPKGIDAPLPLQALASIDAEGEITIGELVLAANVPQPRDVRLVLALHGGKLQVSTLHVLLFGGAIDGQLALDATLRPARVESHLTGRDLDLGALLAAANAPREVRGGKTAARLALNARGDTPHEWMRTASGDVNVVVSQATVVNAHRSDSALSQLASTINPAHASQRTTDLKCGVVRMSLANGIGRFDRTVAIETDQLGLAATGTVNLRDETLDVAFHPSLRAGVPVGVGQIAQLVRVRGPWRDPRVAIDPKGSIGTVAKLGAAVATGGVSALGGLLVLGAITEDGPCAVAMGAAPARKSAPGAQPAQPATPATPQDLLKGLGRLLR